MNATERADGKWVSCPNRFFLKNKMLLGAIYRAELAHELQNLGYSIERTLDDGRFEIAPFTREQIETFSHRREDVEKYMKKHGLESSKGASLAAKETRRRKNNTDRRNLKAKWIEAATSIGIAIDPNAIKKSPIDPQKTVLCVSESDSANVEARRAVQHLSERESILNKYDLLKVAMQRGVGSTRIDHVEKAFTQLAKDLNLLKVDTDRFTTPKLLTLENLNIEMLTGGLNAYKSFITKTEAQPAVAIPPAYPTLPPLGRRGC